MNTRSLLEAILFVAEEPVAVAELAQVLEMPVAEVADELGRWAQELEDRTAGYVLREVAGGWRLYSHPEAAPYLERFAATPTATRLTQASLETLAVVAYRQPVLRTEIEAIRGVQCGEILRQLMERGMVRIAGRADELGRPFLYGTTRNFLQVFGLRSLDELPRASMLRKPEADQNEQTLDQQLEETDQDEYQDDDEFEDDEEDDDDSDEDDIDDDEE